MIKQGGCKIKFGPLLRKNSQDTPQTSAERKLQDILRTIDEISPKSYNTPFVPNPKMDPLERYTFEEAVKEK